MATAESCTGGLLSGLLTSLPGSSRWFQGGVVSYQDEVKRDLLKVPQTILEQHGAVSKETVQAMALGICGLLHVPVGVATSGIAGPDGGSVEKPVGTVCFGMAIDGLVMSDLFLFTGDRASIRRQTVVMALDLLLERLPAGLFAAEG